MNIAILTKNYPSPYDGTLDGVTSVVKDFADSWSDAGHNVFVYHTCTKNPVFIGIIPLKMLNLLNKKYGYSLSHSFNNRLKNKDSIRIENGVRVMRLPRLKLIPGRELMQIQVNKLFNKIIKDMNKEHFIPDLVLAHWEDPNLQLLSMLKRRYKSICVFTCHKIVYLSRPRYLKRALNWLNDVDAMFARSAAIGRQLQDLLGTEEPLPICRSGISSAFFERPISKEVKRRGVLYVGRFLPYKNVDVLIEACSNPGLTSLRHLRIIGYGPEESSLRAIRADNVEFLGKKNHSEIITELDNTSVFSMVSTGETFGLVYIEAMARGCIVIAGDDGGMVGIIQDGVNGYLCPPEDGHALSNILERIELLSVEESACIRANAINTAADFTQRKQAESYLCTALAIAAKEKRNHSDDWISPRCQ